MAQARNKIDVSVNYDEIGLELLQSLEGANRLLGLRRALKKGADVVAKRAKELCPKPGYPGDDPDKKALVDTIGVNVWIGDSAIVAYIGPQYPAGAHGHLIEFGHILVIHGQVVGFVQPKPFMRPAADGTKSEQESAVKSELQAAVRRAEKRSQK